MRKLILLTWMLSLALLVGCGANTGDPSTSNTADNGASNEEAEAAESEHFATHFSDVQFNQVVNEGTTPVMVDFWATWCGPCKEVAPTVEAIARELQGELVVGKIDVDEHPEIADKYQISAIPALLFFKDGEVVETLVGVQSKEEILAVINSL